MRPTQAQLLELLTYEPETGLLRWRKLIAGRGANNRKIGGVVGHLSKAGYVRVSISEKRYMAHTIIWLMQTGEWLPRGVDHIDCDGTNNRWSNLRRATAGQNQANTRARGALKLKGVYRRKKITGAYGGKPYVAQITVAGKCREIGRYRTAEEAHDAYVREAKKAFGEFFRAA